MINQNNNILRQVQNSLKGKLCFGKPTQQGIASDAIYSWGIYKHYLAKGCSFAKWANEQHGCLTLDEARVHVDAFIQKYTAFWSIRTQNLVAGALAEIYGESNMYRSHRAILSESKNKEFIDFCKATGLRRSEFNRLKPENLRYDEATGKYMLTGIRKGSGIHDFPVLSEEAVMRIQNTPSKKKVWNVIPPQADFHSYRAEYCKTIDDLHARPIAELDESEKHYCRGNLSGVVYDRNAILIASRAIGHNRITIFAGEYLFATHGGDFDE
jgi:hypothetical protein